MLEKYLSRVEFSSYEDFKEGFAIKVPENFNFAYDVVDEWARIAPEKTALVWCNEQGEKASFTFAQVKLYSDKASISSGGSGLAKATR